MISLKVMIERSQDGRTAEVDVKKISNCHWDKVSGGVKQRLYTGYSLYGYIDYELAVSLGIDCSGRHAKYGSPAKIMIPANLNSKASYKKGYASLKSGAGVKPRFSFRKPGLIPCSKRIEQEIGRAKRKRITRGELREKLMDEGYDTKQIMNTLNRLGKEKRIFFEGSSRTQSQIIYLPE
jgi:hypothetical protein